MKQNNANKIIPTWFLYNCTPFTMHRGPCAPPWQPLISFRVMRIWLSLLHSSISCCIPDCMALFCVCRFTVWKETFEAWQIAMFLAPLRLLSLYYKQSNSCSATWFLHMFDCKVFSSQTSKSECWRLFNNTAIVRHYENCGSETSQ
jgi:hypothetical protein